MNPMILIPVACIGGAVILACLALVFVRKNASGKKEGNGSATAVLITLYALLNNSLLKSIIQPIRRRLEFFSHFDERTIRKKTVIVFLITLAAFISALLFFWLITKDVMMLLIFILILSFMTDAAVDIFVSNIYIRLMKQQLEYHEILRHKYYELKSVEDANYEACSELNKKETFEIYTQAERINDILSSRDIEASLEKYYDTAPNKYLKLLAGLIYITREYGDTKKDGCSVFIKSIGCLSSEIRAEVFKREKLKYALRSLNIISVIPIFFLKPIRQWAGTSFAPLESFYTSRTGIILGIATILAAFISYMTLRRLQRFDKAVMPDSGRKSISEIMYKAFLHPIVDRLVPRLYTRKKKEADELVKAATSHISIYALYTRKLLIGSLCFIAGLILLIGLNIYSDYTILNIPETPDGYLGGKLSESEYKRIQDITDFDRGIIGELEKRASDVQINELLFEKGIGDDAFRAVATQRIKTKLEKLNESYLKWYELLFCALLFLSGYQMPALGLRFLKSVRRIDMKEEVAQFQTIILMLMHMGRIHVEEVLEWMEMFSVNFKEPIQKCLSNFSSGSKEALEGLKEDVAFHPFVSLIENLQLANEELGVQRAFEELESEMAYNQEKRRQINERIVESKKNLGNIIGFLPVYALIALYLIIPMIISGMDSISAFYKQISGL